MKTVDFIALAVLLYCVSCGSSAQKSAPAKITPGIQYKCMPCGYDCDTVVYSQSGICSHCNMQLVNKETITHKTISPADMCGLNAKELIFLDVRTAAEFNGTAAEKFGAIKNAINIPVHELETRMVELVKYKDKEIVVYCSHSHRSPRASYMLTQKGFKHISNMLGGMSVWKEQVKDNKCNKKLYQPQ